jgi:hypothetical protein
LPTGFLAPVVAKIGEGQREQDRRVGGDTMGIDGISKTKACPKCGRKNPAHMRVCSRCETQLAPASEARPEAASSEEEERLEAGEPVATDETSRETGPGSGHETGLDFLKQSEPEDTLDRHRRRQEKAQARYYHGLLWAGIALLLMGLCGAQVHAISLGLVFVISAICWRLSQRRD